MSETASTLDHRALLASLSDEQRRALTHKANAPASVGVALHFGGVIALGTLIAMAVPFWPLLLLAHGIAIVFLFTLMHETTHRTAFSSDLANDIVARLCGMTLGMGSHWFRYFHLAHHRHTHDPNHDPELASPKPETMWQYVKHVSGLPIWWSTFATLFRNAAGRGHHPYVPKAGVSKVRHEARFMVLFYTALLVVSLAMGSAILLWVWIIPALLGQPFLRLYLLAEHGRCPHVANMFENTRTTFTNALVRRLAWNMPYHAEHHANPTVPFHQLPAFHALTRDHLKSVSNGYRQFNRDYVSGFRG